MTRYRVRAVPLVRYEVQCPGCEEWAAARAFGPLRRGRAVGVSGYCPRCSRVLIGDAVPTEE